MLVSNMMLMLLLFFLAGGMASAQLKVKCKYEGNEFNPGQEAMLNCRSCFCLQSGEWVCKGEPCRKVDQSVYIAWCSGRFAMQAGITARKIDSTPRQQTAGTLTAPGSCENDKGLQMIPSNDITLRNGSKIYMVCKSDVRTEGFMWFINGVRVWRQALKISQSADGRSASIGIDSKDLDLPVNRIACLASPLGVRSARGARIHIINDAELPRGHPKIDAKQRIVEASPGQNITLVCSAIGQPKPQISWYKFSRPVDIMDARFQLTTGGSSLVISNVKPLDAGLYECMASNFVGADTSQHSIELVVNRDASLRVYGELSLSDQGLRYAWQLLELPPFACLFVILNSKNGFYTSRAVTEFRENRLNFGVYQYTASFAPQPAAGVYSVNAIMTMDRCPENETVATQLRVRDAISVNDEVDLVIFPADRTSKAKPLSISHLDMVRIYDVSKTPFLDVTMEGGVIINSPMPLSGTLIPEGSCLKIAVIPSNDCKTEKSCSKTYIRTFDIKPTELGRRFPYRMELKKLAPGSYKSAALMQVAHCDAGLSAFRLVNEKCLGNNQLSFDVSPDTTSIREDMAMAFEERLQTISGKIHFGPAVKVIPINSCLIVSISEDINCHGIDDCGPIKSMIFTNLTFANSTLAYEIVLDETLPVGNYYVGAIVNIGWCAKSSKSSNRLRPGDYETTERNSLFVSDTASSDFRLDLTAHLYTIPVSGKEVNILGAIELHPKVLSDISPSSCLVIQVQDVSKCNETAICNAPYFAQKRIANPVINPRSAIAYNLTLNSLTGTNFSITAVLNVGWCQLAVKGNRQASSGDYHSIGLNVFEVSPDQTAAVKNFSIHLFGERKDRNELTVSLTLSLPRKTSPLFYIPKNSCISFREASQGTLESVYLKNLTFTVDGATTVTFSIVPKPKSDTFTLKAVLNVGWCSDKLNRSRNIKNGDYSAEFTNSDFDGMVYLEEYKDQKNSTLVEGPATNRCKNKNCTFFSKCEISSDGQPSCVCSSACPSIYKPVCGTDDKSYDNQCMMEFEACTKQEEITIKKEGKCIELAPDRCKNKNCTFFSKCEISSDGQPSCVCSSACPLIYKPVCGTDDKNYDNQCMMEFEACTKQEEITIKKEGNCTELAPDRCKNKNCTFFSKCEVSSDGQPSCVCSSACPSIYKPVCGTDDKSYDNQCMMEFEACTKQEEIKIKKEGKCIELAPDRCKNKNCTFFSKCEISSDGQPSCVCSSACPSIYKPVCGTDDKSYDNQCMMEFEACTKQEEITIKKEGKCIELAPDRCKNKNCTFFSKCEIGSDGQPSCVCSSACPLIYKPVCGTDDKNYDNQCMMEFEACTKQEEITIKKEGNCTELAPDRCKNKNCTFFSKCEVSSDGQPSCVCSSACPSIYKPVCGTDDKSYDNQCMMEFEACTKQEEIKIKKEGKCIELAPDRCKNKNCTFFSKCEIGSDGQPSCVCSSACPLIYKPVCGTDDKSYDNQCMMEFEACTKQEEITIKKEGNCTELAPDRCKNYTCKFFSKCEIGSDGQPSCVCSSACPLIYKPVCGTDDKNYDNQCMMEFEACTKQEEITIKKEGKCIELAPDRCKNKNCTFFSKCEIGSDGQPSCVCSSACPSIYKPVCGTDDKSYDNQCMMEFEACTKQEEITIKKEGKCIELAPGTILVRVALSTKDGSLEIPEASCLNFEFIDATFFDQTELIKSEIHRFDRQRATNKDQFEAILAVDTAEVFEITVSAVLHFKHCFSSIISGDFSGNVTFEIEDDKRIYDVAIVMSKYENPSAHPCDWVTCAFNGNCSAVGKVARCSCPECPEVQRPVCASDGKTYSSACAMKRYSCVSHKELSVLFTGICEEYFVIKGTLKSNATKQPNENCAIIRVDSPTALNFRIPNSKYIVVMPKDLKNIINRTRVLATTGNCPLRLYEAPLEIIDDFIIRNKTGNSTLTVYSFEKGCKSCLFSSVCKISGKKLVCACIINCPDDSDPVCGSNGRTYKNLCIMKSENCAQQRNVQVVHVGKCDQDDCKHTSCFHGKCTHSINGTEVCKCMLTCPNVSEFQICGSNGKTYKSDCERKRDTCLTKTPIDIAHIGSCEVSNLGLNGIVYAGKMSKTVDKQVSHLCLIAKFGSTQPLESSVMDTNKFFQQLQKLLLSPFSYNFDLPKSMTSFTSLFSLMGRLQTQPADSQIYQLLRKLQNQTLSINDLDLMKITLKFLANMVQSGRTNFGNCSGVEGNEENYKKYYSLIPGIEGVHVVVYEKKCTEKCTDHSKCHRFSNGTSKCICQLGCPRNLDPLCASDGKSYDNLCIMQRESCLQKAGLTLVHEGECEPKCTEKCTDHSKCHTFSNGTSKCICQLGCPRNLDPLCASDGKSYDNLCIMQRESCLQKAGLTLVHDGECDDTVEVSGLINAAGVASDLSADSCLIIEVRDTSLQDVESLSLASKTINLKTSSVSFPYKYTITSLKPESNAVQVTVSATLHVNHCSKSIKSGDFITDTMFPMNLTDRSKSSYNVDLTLVKYHPDRCSIKTCKFFSKCKIGTDGQPSCVCSPACPLIYKPVCGSDNKDYANLCLMQFEACTKQTDVTVKKEGLCNDSFPEPKCTEKCTDHSKCHTFSNGTSKCICQLGCPRNLDPLCASDGKSYDNLCIMQRESCLQKAGLTLVHDGECDDTVEVSGLINAAGVASDISADSCLIIEVRDTSLQDVESLSLASKTIHLKTSSVSFPYKYTITSLKPESNAVQVTVSATLHVNHCSKSIKSGDFITDTMFPMNLTDRSQSSYNVDLTLVKYHPDRCSSKTCKFFSKCKIGTDGQPSCVCSPACPLIYKPVCGSDNKDYANLCLMQFEACTKQTDVTVKKEGRCNELFPEPKCTEKCTGHSKCHTFSNGTSKCICQLSCPRNLDPLCASDGKSYDNLCIMQRESCLQKAGLTLVHDGECDDTVEVSGLINAAGVASDLSADSCLIIEVRDTSLQDVESLSLASKTIHLKTSSVSFPYKYTITSLKPESNAVQVTVSATLHVNHCSKSIKSGDFITDTMFPMNLTDRSKSSYNVDLTLVKYHPDRCSSKTCKFFSKCKIGTDGQPSCVCSPACPLIYKPVCGSDNKDYANLCLMQFEACTKQTDVTVKKEGLCNDLFPEPKCTEKCTDHSKCHTFSNGTSKCICHLGCPRNLDPLCASDGKSYDNLCIMQRESCLQKAGLTLVHDGECDDTVEVSGLINAAGVASDLSADSCLIIEVRDTSLQDVESLSLASKTIHLKTSSVSFPYKYTITSLKPESNAVQVTVSATLHVNHCSKSIKSGDFITDTMFPMNLTDRSKSSYNVDLTLVKYHPDRCSSKTCKFFSKCKIGTDGQPSCVCSPACPLIYKPVCGSDNKDYANLCLMQFEACTKRTDVTVKKEGLCNELFPVDKPCRTELGDEVPNGHLIQYNGAGCPNCRCQDGQITCPAISCPDVPCIDGILQLSEGDCCPTCVKRTCEVPESKKSLRIGESYFVRANDRTCKFCSCVIGGRFSCKEQICRVPTCKRPVKIDSACCPVCPGKLRCKDQKTGALYKAGEKWSNGDMNGCSKCSCVPVSATKSAIECKKPSCPTLNCQKTVYLQGSCCPTCYEKYPKGPMSNEVAVKFRKAELILTTTWTSSCLEPKTNNVYSEGESWVRGCQTFECSASGIIAASTRCPLLACPKAEQIKKDNSCCAECRPASKPVLFCAGTGLTLTVPKKYLPFAKPSQLIFDNSDCTATDNGTHLILRTDYQSCGTTSQTGSNSFKYRNVARTIEFPDAIISRVRLIQIPVVCIVPKKSRISFSKKFMPRFDLVTSHRLMQEAVLPKVVDVFMEVTTKDRQKLPDNVPAVVEVGEELFVDIRIAGNPAGDVTVTAKKCYLTPTSDRYNPIQHTLIRNGCPADPTVKFFPLESNGRRFSFKSLIFSKSKLSGFFLHCDTVTCDSRQKNSICAKSCKNTRRARFAIRKKERFLSKFYLDAYISFTKK